MSKRNRIISVIVAVAMAIGLVSYAIFVIQNANHICSGDDCQICEQVQYNLKAFNNQTPKPEAVALIVCVAWALVLTLGVKINLVSRDSLVDLKAKLSN